ncbi:MAG: hypothetical protein AMXMBFR84_16550 [Candidatus Hydrogenedentota bacterium]
MTRYIVTFKRGPVARVWASDPSDAERKARALIGPGIPLRGKPTVQCADKPRPPMGGKRS